MKIHSIRLVLLLAILSLSLSQTSPNFVPPPSITSSIIIRLNESTVGTRLITSKRIQDLQITQGTASSGTISTFKFNFFNRSAPNNYTTYQHVESGSWRYLDGTRDTLSCNIVYETNQQVFGLLNFNSDNGSVAMIAKAPLASFPDDVKNMVGINPNYFTSKIVMGENCNAGYFMSDYNGTGVLYRLSDNKDSLTTVTLPPGFNAFAMTESTLYGVAQARVYRYNPSTLDYSAVFSVKPGRGYTIKHVRERLVVTSYNITNTSYSTPYPSYRVDQSIYFLKDEGAASLRQLGSVEIVSVQGWEGLVEVFPSPQMTKVGFSYFTAIDTQRIVVKSIDYTRNTVSDVTFQDPARALTTIKGVRVGLFDFSDYFVVFRNTTFAGAGNPAYEDAYQIVGNQIIFLRARELSTTRELRDFRRIFVDSSITNKLIVLNGYSAGVNCVEVEEFDYGSLSSTARLLPPVLPPLATFSVPHSATEIPTEGFGWTFREATASSTKFTVVRANPNSPSNIDRSELTLTGSWDLLFQNERCRLFGDGSTVSLYQVVGNSAALAKVADVQAAVAAQGVAVSASTRWRVSDYCDRLSADSSVFYLTGSPTTCRPMQNDFSLLTWTAADSNLTNLVKGNELWRLTAGNSYVRYFTASSSTPPLLPNTRLYQLGSRILITSTDVTTGEASVYGLSDDGSGNLRLCLEFSLQFNSLPTFWVSSNLTKVMVMGLYTAPTAATASNRIDAFFIDYDRLTNRPISFPASAVKDPLNTFMQLDQKWLYIRQLNGAASASDPNLEWVFYLDQDTVPKVASSVNITDVAASWRKSALEATGDGKFYVLTASRSTDAANTVDTYTLKQVEVSAVQANFNSNTQPGVTGYMVDGVLRLCSPGCNECSVAGCNNCLSGFAYDALTASCFACALNCLTCSVSNPSLCTACLTGSYLSGSSCLPCSAACVTCVSDASTCVSCPPGQFFDSVSTDQCAFCQRGCESCSSATVCTLCSRGFALDVVNSVTVCRGCAFRCSSCNPANITECTSCAAGLQLVGGACVQCPDKCSSCSNGKCAICVAGFAPNPNGVCVKICQLPCATCVDNQPSLCLSCFSGSVLAGNTCEIDLACMTTNTCTDCGQGLGYLLVGSNCLPCTQISNCLQCSANNADICAICLQGYYPSTTACNPCPPECLTCVSPSACTACAPGFTLPDSQLRGQCLACSPPCATCIGSSSYCSSCVGGFTKRGWKCQNNTYVGFKVQILSTEANILSALDAIIASLLQIVGENPANFHTITFENITTGSTIVTGMYAPSTPSASLPAAASALASGLSAPGATLGTYPIGAVSASSFGLSSSEESGSEASSNVGLIVGIAVGLVVLLGVGILIVYFLCRKKGEQNSQAITNTEGNNSTTEAPQNHILTDDKFTFEAEMRQPVSSKAHGDQFSSDVWQKHGN